MDLRVYIEFGELGHGSGGTYLNLMSWVLDVGVYHEFGELGHGSKGVH